jgi:hypothetical protein
MFAFFSSKIGLPETTNTRVEKYLNNERNTMASIDHQIDLIKNLPQSLRLEVIKLT